MWDWIGEWEGTYKVTGGDMPGTAKEYMKISSALDNTCLLIYIEGYIVEDKKGYKWFSEEYLTYNFKGEIVGFYISNSGGDYMETIKGEFDGDSKMILKGKCKLYSTLTTWELKEGKIYRYIKDTYKDINPNDPGVETVFSKKK